MKITLTNPDLDIEIHDDWFDEAGARNFRPTAPTYRAQPMEKLAGYPAIELAIDHVIPPRRDPGYRWFDHDRMVMVLRGIVRGDLLPTMPVHQRPGESLFRVVDGLHRFYASKALGFTHLPVSVVRYFDISDPNC